MRSLPDQRCSESVEIFAENVCIGDSLVSGVRDLLLRHLLHEFHQIVVRLLCRVPRASVRSPVDDADASAASLLFGAPLASQGTARVEDDAFLLSLTLVLRLKVSDPIRGPEHEPLELTCTRARLQRCRLLRRALATLECPSGTARFGSGSCWVHPDNAQNGIAARQAKPVASQER